MPIVYIKNNVPSCNAIKMVFRVMGISAQYRNVDEFKEHDIFVKERFGKDAELPIVFNDIGELISIGFDADAITQEFGNN